MATVAGIGNNIPDDDVVCTPDFPLEPLCEVLEDNNDDDVQCIGPVVNSRPSSSFVSRNVNSPLTNMDNTPLPTDNIVQMTENDVTVNAATGGLKFRVDPQTLSSNKMYRLPDGRIFAINANPNMPGGYSATIVAVTDDVSKVQSKGATFAAKVSSVRTPTMTLPPLKPLRTPENNRSNKSKRSTPKSSKAHKKAENPTRELDLNVPVEWYRYNLIDAVDALEYSLQRLNKLKQEATTAYLRTRTKSEMKYLHKQLNRVLNTSSSRFMEISENINKGWTQYLSKKVSRSPSEDDDVEILHDDNDDPIFIDENSLDSNANESQDIDLTVLGSDHNDSSEKSPDKNNQSNISNVLNDTDESNICIVPDSVVGGIEDNATAKKGIESIDLDPKTNEIQEAATIIKLKNSGSSEEQVRDTDDVIELNEKETNKRQEDDVDMVKDKLLNNHPDKKLASTTSATANNLERKNKEVHVNDLNGDEVSAEKEHKQSITDEDILKDDNADSSVADKKMDDQEMSEEMIENLLCDENDDDSMKGDKKIIEEDKLAVDKDKETVMDISG